MYVGEKKDRKRTPLEYKHLPSIFSTNLLLMLFMFISELKTDSWGRNGGLKTRNVEHHRGLL
jgi:hypothetical protein